MKGFRIMKHYKVTRKGDFEIIISAPTALEAKRRTRMDYSLPSRCHLKAEVWEPEEHHTSWWKIEIEKSVTKRNKGPFCGFG